MKLEIFRQTSRSPKLIMPIESQRDHDLFAHCTNNRESIRFSEWDEISSLLRAHGVVMFSYVDKTKKDGLEKGTWHPNESDFSKGGK